MLSKMHTLVLGIIKESPINPYEIIRLLGELHVKQWLPYADSSVYAGINTLVRKEYITGEQRKTGKMPEKSVYSVTVQGRQAFEEAIRAFLLDASGDYIQLTVVMLFICHLPKDEVLRLLSNRLSILEKTAKGLTERIKFMNADRRIPDISVMTAKHHLYFIEAGIRTTVELIAEAGRISKWNAFLSKELIEVEG